MILVDPEGTVAARAPGNVGFTNLYTGDKGEHGQPGTFMGANGKWSLDVQSLNRRPQQDVCDRLSRWQRLRRPRMGRTQPRTYTVT